MGPFIFIFLTFIFTYKNQPDINSIFDFILWNILLTLTQHNIQLNAFSSNPLLYMDWHNYLFLS